jgi:hypothetical protein
VRFTAAMDPHGFAANAWSMIGHARGASARGCDLAAPDPMRLCLSCGEHWQDCESVKKF